MIFCEKCSNAVWAPLYLGAGYLTSFCRISFIPDSLQCLPAPQGSFLPIALLPNLWRVLSFEIFKYLLVYFLVSFVFKVISDRKKWRYHFDIYTLSYWSSVSMFKYLLRAHSQLGTAFADGNRALGKSQPTNNSDTYPCPCEIRMTNTENKFNYMMRSAFHVFDLSCIKYVFSKEKFINTPIPRVVHTKYCNSLQVYIFGFNFIPQNL